MKEKKIKKLLYKKLDAELTESETRFLNKELINTASLADEDRDLQKIRKLVAESAETSFKPFFETRVLNRINLSLDGNDSFASFANSLVLSFKQVGLAAILILILLLSYNLKSGNNRSLQSFLGISETSYEYYAFDPVQNFIGSNR